MDTGLDRDSVAVERRRGIFVDPRVSVRIGTRGDLVTMDFGPEGCAAMRTPDAVRIGLALARSPLTLEPGEFMSLKINGRQIHLLPEIAQKVGSVIVAKACRVDDRQMARAPH